MSNDFMKIAESLFSKGKEAVSKVKMDDVKKYTGTIQKKITDFSQNQKKKEKEKFNEKSPTHLQPHYTIALKSSHGWYLSARKDHTVKQVKNLDEWEKWEVQKSSNPKKLMFRSAHGLYLSTKTDSVVNLSYDSQAAESFEIIADPKNRGIGIKSNYNKYLSARKDISGHVGQQNKMDEWETWKVVIFSTTKIEKVTLKSCYETYLSASDNGSVLLSRQCSGWEEFKVKKNGNLVGFESAHGKFLSARLDSHGTFNQSKNISDWEWFRLIPSKSVKGGFSVETFHGTLLSAKRDKSVGQSKNIGEGEVFILKHV